MTGFDLASRAEISEGGLSQIINGKIKNLKIDTALRIAKALEVAPMWLITGDDSGMPVSALGQNGSSSDEYIQVPRFEVKFDPETDESPKYTEFKYDRIFTFHKSYFDKYSVKSPKYCKSFKVAGDGMEPLIRRGDYVIVDCSPDISIADGEIYAFVMFKVYTLNDLFLHCEAVLLFDLTTLPTKMSSCQKKSYQKFPL